MASILSNMVLVMVILMALSSYSLSLNLPTSTISAAPAFLPNPPLLSPQSSPPTLSPDINPLFPSPGGTISPSPAESSSVPTIPSSPSPPNPDQVANAPGTSMVISPSGPLPVPFSDALRSYGYGSLNPLLFLGLMVFW